jgi:hypothetical protein
MLRCSKAVGPLADRNKDFSRKELIHPAKLCTRMFGAPRHITRGALSEGVAFERALPFKGAGLQQDESARPNYLCIVVR